MRIAVPLVLVAVACATGATPMEWRIVTPTSTDATFSCVQMVVDSMGYTVTSSDRAGGFVRAQRMAKYDARDVLLVTALQSTSGTELHVTAESYGQGNAIGVSIPPNAMAPPSGKVVEDGSYVVARCGPTIRG